MNKCHALVQGIRHYLDEGIRSRQGFDIHGARKRCSHQTPYSESAIMAAADIRQYCPECRVMMPD